MSIAAYEVFRENNLDIFYIHPELDRLIWMHPKRPSVDLADRIKLCEYLYAYACCLNIKKSLGIQDVSRSHDLTTHLLHESYFVVSKQNTDQKLRYCG